MAYRHIRFPGGKAKAVTFSYDDGVRDDIRLAEICVKYGIKCTFNINTAFIAARDGEYYLSAQEIKKHLLGAGHEIAVHGHEHKAPGLCTPAEIIQDVLNCRLNMEAVFGGIIRGMAYPDSGITNTSVTPYAVIKQCLTDLDIAYARTLAGDNDRFTLPEDWHAWMPTAHHANPLAVEYAKKFVQMDVTGMYASSRWPKLFYLWGHSFEFTRDDNWALLTQLCETLGGHDDIWYATNIEICDYVNACRALRFSADGRRAYNPTFKEVWFQVDNTLYSVQPGETAAI